MSEDKLAGILPYLTGIWTQRRRIALIALAFVLLAALKAFMASRTYEAKATVVVSPPPFRAGGTNNEEIAAMMPKSLNVEDYKRIAESAGILQMAVEKLRGNVDWPEDKIEQFLKPSTLEKRMTASTQIIEKTPQAVRYSVVLTLSAQADTPARAASLADAWAKSAVEAVREYALGTTTASLAFLEGEYTGVTTELTDDENKLHETQKSADTLLTVFNNETMDMLNSVEKAMDAVVMQYDNETEQLLEKTDNETDSLLQTFEMETTAKLADYEKATRDTTDQYENETDKQIKDIKDQGEKKMRQLEADLAVDLDRERVASLASQVVRSEELVKYVSKEMSDNEERTKQLLAELEQHPMYLVLAKAVTDDALWDRLVKDSKGGGLPEGIDGLKLRTEQTNPVYQRLLTELATIRVNFKTLPKELAYLQNQIAETKTEYTALFTTLKDKEYRLAEAQRQVALVAITLERQRKTGLEKIKQDGTMGLENLKRDRATQLGILKRQCDTQLAVTKRERETEAQGLSREWLAKLSQKESERETESQIMTREGKLDAERLERLVTQQKTKYEALGSRTLSARLAKADNTADLVLVGEVIPPDKPQGLPRSLLLVVSLVLGLIVGMAYVVAAERLKRLRAFAAGQIPTSERTSREMAPAK